MRPPQLRFTLRGLMLAVVLIALNLAGVVATTRYFSRPMLPLPIGYGNGRGWTKYKPDGSIEYYVGNAETGYRLTHVGWSRPRPTLLRIWSPVIASGAISVLTLGVASSRRPLPGITTRRMMIVVPVLALVIWLILPLVQIANHPEDDHHKHTYPEVPGSVHENSFWPRYWRLLLGRPWPGDYICPFPPRRSN